jgi:hypothetical protein
LLAAAAGWLIGWWRGRNSFRDEHGRLKPVPALTVSFALLIGVSSLIVLGLR